MVVVTLEELNRVLCLPTLLTVRVRTEAFVAEPARIIAALRARVGRAAIEAAAEPIAPNRQFVIDALIES